MKLNLKLLATLAVPTVLLGCSGDSSVAAPEVIDESTNKEEKSEAEPRPSQRFAFQGKQGDHVQILVATAEGGQAEVLIDRPSDDLLGGWSKDGTEVLFLSSLGATGQRQKHLYRTTISDRVPVRLSDAASAFMAAAWSPEQDRIAYSLDGRVLIGDASGAEPEVTSGIIGDIVTAIEWSPDGSRIAAHSITPAEGAPSGVSSKVSVVDPTSGSVTIIADELGWMSLPHWHPTEPSLVFVMYHVGTADICVASVPDGELSWITQTDWIELDPNWSPDGRSLVFVSNERGGSSLVVLDTETGDRLEILSGPAQLSFPSFAPDGVTIAFVSDESGKAEYYLTSLESTGFATGVSFGFGLDWAVSPALWAPISTN